MRRYLSIVFLIPFFFLYSTAQTKSISDMLENTLKGVVTFAIYQTDFAMKPNGL